MADSLPSDPHELRTDALARIDAVERSLEQLAATVRSTAADLQHELGEIRLSVLEMHSQAVSKPAPAPEAAVGSDAPEGNVEGARLVALDLIGRGVGAEEAKQKLTDTFPGIDADRVLQEVGASAGA